MKTGVSMLVYKEIATALNTHRIHVMVLRKLFYLPAEGKSANEPLGFIMLIFLFFSHLQIMHLRVIQFQLKGRK